MARRGPDDMASQTGNRSARARARTLRAGCEPLEGRALLVATLAPVADLTVPATVGLQLPLDGGSGNPQTYAVTSSNPTIATTVARGRFLTIGVSHAAAGPNDITFAGTMTFQLFDDLTPIAASRIAQLVNQGFYTSPTAGNDPRTGAPFPSKNFHRVASGFPTANEFIVQGGSANGNGTGDIDQPGFPFADEFVQQLVFSGTGQLAMANAGDDTNDSQFFITTGSPRFLDYNHTIFGQLVAGREVLDQTTRVARGGEDGTTPVNPILFTSTTLSDASPDGVIHIDATRATPGQAATVTVTATDAVDGTTTSRAFTVTAATNTTNERPFLRPVPDQQTTPGRAVTFQLDAVDPEGNALTYTVQGGVNAGSAAFTPVRNAAATVSPAGLVRVAPDAGFTGTINLLVGVRDGTDRSGTGNLDAPGNFDTQALTLTVTPSAVVTAETGAVRVLNGVLIVTPTPRRGGRNTIRVDQVDGTIRVLVNGVLDTNQPAADTLSRLVVYGGRAGDTITVGDAVTLPTTLDGGHGGNNRLRAGGAPTRMHGWFGQNTLRGGPRHDQLIGREGRVRFLRSPGRDFLFVGDPRLVLTYKHHRAQPSEGTTFHFEGDRIVVGPPPPLRRPRRG